MERITKKRLDAQAERINRLTNSPLTLWGDDGKMNVGHYYISGAYGGYNLAKIVTDGGGESCPLYTGHIPARELSNLIAAFIYGIMEGERNAAQGAA
ncbi:MAG: hypothetical protein EBT13_16145 [Rhodobacteraceae bacterium]|nr:hypothetical protein [Paracoccaceae bacterium]